MLLNSLCEIKPSITFSKQKLKVAQSSDNESNKIGHRNTGGQQHLSKPEPRKIHKPS